jgi:hypothetical protein
MGASQWCCIELGIGLGGRTLEMGDAGEREKVGGRVMVEK